MGENNVFRKTARKIKRKAKKIYDEVTHTPRKVVREGRHATDKVYSAVKKGGHDVVKTVGRVGKNFPGYQAVEDILHGHIGRGIFTAIGGGIGRELYKKVAKPVKDSFTKGRSPKQHSQAPEYEPNEAEGIPEEQEEAPEENESKGSKSFEDLLEELKRLREELLKQNSKEPNEKEWFDDEEPEPNETPEHKENPFDAKGFSEKMTKEFKDYMKNAMKQGKYDPREILKDYLKEKTPTDKPDVDMKDIESKIRGQYLDPKEAMLKNLHRISKYGLRDKRNFNADNLFSKLIYGHKDAFDIADETSNNEERYGGYFDNSRHNPNAEKNWYRFVPSKRRS